MSGKVEKHRDIKGDAENDENLRLQHLMRRCRDGDMEVSGFLLWKMCLSSLTCNVRQMCNRSLIPMYIPTSLDTYILKTPQLSFLSASLLSAALP